MPREVRAALPLRRISVVIPARDEARTIGRTLEAVFAQEVSGVELEVLVVDDGSRDDTAAVASGSGARVLRLGRGDRGGSPGAARNRGAAVASGDPVVFLDADCAPAPGWLEALLAAHESGEAVVGGALGAPTGLSASARCDHYCGSYYVHPARPAGYVPNHTPANLSVRRDAFIDGGGFAERLPLADGHEELPWQARLAGRGVRIRFEPGAVVFHHNRAGLRHLLRRHYRWGYSALEGKAATGACRWPWLYRRPALLVAASFPLAFAHTVHTVGCWLRHRRMEPLLFLPLILASRLSYAAGMAAGGLRWLRGGAEPGEFRR
ncbi:MAG TPA: glycosyltransferase [Thermoanaerobaculia bacterium]|nr:glycosyltransferase [Thermoanaerobaculia bacterium]